MLYDDGYTLLDDGTVLINCDDENFYGQSVVTGGNYSLDDCVLVRTTDAFPDNKVIQTPRNGNAFVSSMNEILNYPICEILRNNGMGNDLIDESNKYNLFCKSFRSTIHFTINGLVGSHTLGDFSGRDYVIIEPLKYHINDSSLLSLAVHDTYFDNDMLLSDEAMLVISDTKYEEIKNDSRYTDALSRFKIFVYSGKNQSEAVAKTLNYMGYDNFLVSNFGYTHPIQGDSYEKDPSYEMVDFIDSVRRQYSIDSISHFGSDYNMEENNLTNAEAISVQLGFLDYVIENVSIPQDLLDKVNLFREKGFFDGSLVDGIGYDDDMSLSSMYFRNECGITDVMIEFVNCVGLDNLAKLTNEYNSQYVDTRTNTGSLLR